MGSSRDIAIGPVAVVSLLLGTLLQKEIDPSNKVEYQRLAFTATFFAGITQATLGVLRYPDFLLHDFTLFASFAASCALLFCFPTFLALADIIGLSCQAQKKKETFWVCLALQKKKKKREKTL